MTVFRTNGVWVAFGFCLSAVTACTQSERDPITCVGACISAGARTGSGSGPGGGGGGAGNGDAVTLEGSVELLSSLFSDRFLFGGTAEVEVEAANGGTVRGDWDGTTPFSIAGVRSATVTWALTTPDTGAVFPTVEPLDTRQPDSLGIVYGNTGVVSEELILLPYSVLPVPIEVDPDRAQVLMLIYRSGVTVTSSAAPTVIYSDAGGFSDTSGETDASGVVLLPNVTAPDWPGRDITVTLSGTATGQYDLRVVSEAVTALVITP